MVVVYYEIKPGEIVEISCIKTAIVNKWAIKQWGNIEYSATIGNLNSVWNTPTTITMSSNPQETNADIFERDSANTTRLKIKVAGTYKFEFNWKFRHGSTGVTGTIHYPIIRLKKNWIIFESANNAWPKNGDNDEHVHLHDTIVVNANDYIEVQVEALFAWSGWWSTMKLGATLLLN